jgi:lipopolysaccharide/colanic/teichoic acid biosynthesis glycosyltransferase
MARRLLDIVASATGLALLAAPLGIVLFLIWRQDGHSPFYVADRAGRGGNAFKMVKVRSMIAGADKSGVESTSANDRRITPLGHFVRQWKIDELGQLWNVLKGDMSLVGPRPNTLNEVATYSADELRLLEVCPGITDFSSIVFSDEGEILKGSIDPDADYTRLIRPWKSRLGLIYVRHRSTSLNLRLIGITIMAVFSRELALTCIAPLIRRYSDDEHLLRVCARTTPLGELSS